MKSKCLLFLLLASFIPSFLIGCSNIKDSLSVEKAKQLVIEKHTNSNGSPTIMFTEVKNNAYYVEWEKKENKESGTDKVTKDGEVIMVEARIE